MSWAPKSQLQIALANIVSAASVGKVQTQMDDWTFKRAAKD